MSIQAVHTVAAPNALSPATRAHRDRILEAALDLLRSGGRESLSSRSVSALAGVQAPTIYRIFGDMNGLLDAVAERGYSDYLARRKGLPRSGDPIADIHNGWDLHVELGLDEPELYALIYAESPAGQTRPALATVAGALRNTVHRIAKAGRLRMSEERATHLVHSASRGLVLTLIALPEAQRDRTLSDMARDSAISAIITEPRSSDSPGVISAAVALRAVLPQTEVLTPVERALLTEWLDRIANSG